MISAKDVAQNILENDKRNEELLDRLKQKGVALGEHRSVEHHFWAPGQDKAALLARELYKRGYLLLALAPRPGTDSATQWWNIEAGIRRSPYDAASRKVTEELANLAAQFDGVYDGWGTAV